MPDQPRPRLSQATIVAAAIDLADRDGLTGLSMRRIADELGAGAMSLYRHVADKDALLVEMVAEVGQRFPYPDGTGAWGWRERVDAAVDVDWRMYLQHPWVVLAYSSPRFSYPPESLRCLDWLAEGFTEAGAGAPEAIEMSLTVWAQVHGAALSAVGDRLLADASPRSESGGLAELLAGPDPEGGLPPRLAAVAGGAWAAGLADPRRLLDRSIELLCAGFAAEIAGRSVT